VPVVKYETNPQSKFKDEYYVRTYELRRSGKVNSKAGLARELGVKEDTLAKWFRQRPALRDAWDRADPHQGVGTTLVKYIYDRLPPRLQLLWDDIELAERDANGNAKIRALFADEGRRAQQQLFLHAVVNFNFNLSSALRKCCITKSTYDEWVRDPGFAKLVEELQWHKKNFVEGHLMSLIAAGDSPATIFANKTLNRDRGYADKSTVEHVGTIQHNHAGFDLGALGLPPDILRVVLDHIRLAAAADPNVPRLPGIVEGEVVRTEVIDDGTEGDE
jgi:hypothetical protein